MLIIIIIIIIITVIIIVVIIIVTFVIAVIILIKLLLLTACVASDSALSYSYSLILIVILLLPTCIVFCALYLLFAKAIKGRRCIQQEYRGTNFAYFVPPTILLLICNEKPLAMITTTFRKTCYFTIIFVFPFAPILKMFAKNTAAGLGGVNTQNSRLTVVRLRCRLF